MGSIRSKEIKRASSELAERMPESASKDFDKNKEAIRDIVHDKSKRNAVAGYLVRVAKTKEEREKH